MNKKGFTVIEMMSTFILVTAAAILLVRLALTVKEIYTINDLKTVLYVKQANIMDKIYNDINNKTLSSMSSCGTNCIQFTYSDGAKQLVIDTNKNTIRYDNYTYKLTDSNYINSIVDNSYSSSSGNIFNVNISIKDKLVAGEYGINIIFTTNVSIPTFTFDNISKRNLVTNGDLSLKNNNNFTQFGDYENGYLVKTSSSRYMSSTDEFIKIDPSKSYIISVDIKSSNSDANYYFGFREYDVDFKEIGNSSLYYNNTIMHLTQPLVKNQSEYLYVDNVTNMTTTPTNNYRKGIIVWNYKNSKGENYVNPAYINNTDGKQFLAYSKNVYTNIFELDDEGNLNISTDTNGYKIKLKSKWSNNTIPKETSYTVYNSQTGQDETVTAPTYLSQANAGTVFTYSAINNKKIGTSWTTYTSGTITGLITNGTGNANKFKIGTVYIKPAIYGNYNGTADTTTYIRNITFKEV